MISALSVVALSMAIPRIAGPMDVKDESLLSPPRRVQVQEPNSEKAGVLLEPTAVAMLCSVIHEEKTYSLSFEVDRSGVRQVIVRRPEKPELRATFKIFDGGKVDVTVDPGFAPVTRKGSVLTSEALVAVLARFRQLRYRSLEWHFSYRLSRESYGTLTSRKQPAFVVELQELPLAPGFQIYFFVTDTGAIEETTFGM